MSSGDPLPRPATPPSASDAADALLRHFPDEVRAAYRRFETSHEPSDADTLVIAVVRDHIPAKQNRAAFAPADHLQLVSDLGFDSVAITEMVFFLEDLFQVRISNEEILRVRTIGDLRAFVRAKVTQPPSAASA